MWRRWGLGAALLLCGLAAGAARGDPKATAQRLEDLLEDAAPKEALKILQGPDGQELLDDPEQSRWACGHAADHAVELSEDATNLFHAADLMKAFVAFGEACVERHPDVADAHRALGNALLGQARFDASLGEAKDAALWERAAAECAKAAELEPEAEHVVSAARFLRDAARRLGDPPLADLLDRAAAVAASARERFPSSGEAVIESCQIDLLLAETLLAAREKGKATDLAKGVLEKVDPYVGKRSNLGDDAEAAWNRAVNFLLTNELDRDVVFKDRRIETRWDYFELQAPWGSHWRVRHGRDATTFMTSLTRYDDRGRTRISFYRYKWSSEYTSDEGDVGGDNPTGLMRLDLERDEAFLTKVTRRKKMIRGRLNRQIPKTVGYELEGVDEDGDPWWIRAWWFKGELNDRTFNVYVWRWGPDAGPDAEIEHVLDSITELAPK